MKNKYKDYKNLAEKEIIQRMSGWIPKFTDIFDEESFYIFAFVVVVLAIVVAIIASRFITIKDSDHVDWDWRNYIFNLRLLWQGT